jgi:chitodextrinase
MEQRYVPLAFTAGAGTLTATAPANGNLAPPGVYMLFVVDASGVPSVAKMVSVGTAADTTPPSAPSGLTATASGSSRVDLSWSASSDDVGVTGYRVERCQGAACTSFAQVGTPTGTSFSDTGLAANTTYRFRVRAADAAGNLSAYSAIATAGTLADTTAPSAPTGLTATAVGSTQVNLAWTAAGDDVGVTGYGVERCQSAGCTTFAEIATPTTTSFSNTGLAANTTYRFRVRARDAAGNLSAYSAVAEATTTAAPPTPAGLVGAWAFGEGTGTTTADASGNGSVGTITAATWTTQGRYGNALSFNGSSSTVRVASSASLNPGSAMTLSAWIRPAASQSGWRTILQRQADAYFLTASSDAAGRSAGGGTLGGNVQYVVAPAANPINAWTHVALTYDGTMLRMYVNGTQVITRAAGGTVQTTTNPLWIGGNQPYGEYFQGLIDDLRVYNRALTAADIQTDMNTPVDAGTPLAAMRLPTCSCDLSARNGLQPIRAAVAQ